MYLAKLLKTILSTAGARADRINMIPTPRWNQIHIRGFYPDKGPSPVESPDALRRVNPSGGHSAFFAGLNKIRTKPREDEARQLFDLAVR
jgi:hypothetical protein